MRSIAFLAVAAAGLLSASCAKDGRTGDGTGSLKLKLEAETSVPSHLTRATVTLDAPPTEEFDLRIRKSDGTFDESWESITDHEGVGRELKVGTYSVWSNYGDPTQEGFGKAAFGAEDTFQIADGTITNKTLRATLSNMAVTIGYTEAFRGYFSGGHHAVITTDAGSEISFEDTPQAMAFIQPAAFTVTVHYTRQNGNSGSAQFEVEDNIAACRHLAIEVDINRETGGAGAALITITFDDTVISETIGIETGDPWDE